MNTTTIREISTSLTVDKTDALLDALTNDLDDTDMVTFTPGVPTQEDLDFIDTNPNPVAEAHSDSYDSCETDEHSDSDGEFVRSIALKNPHAVGDDGSIDFDKVDETNDIHDSDSASNTSQSDSDDDCEEPSDDQNCKKEELRFEEQQRDKQTPGGGRSRRVKKPRRFKPGTVALREIRKMQRGCDLLIPKLPFQRLVREITHYYRDDIRFTEDALEAIHEASEAYLIELFANTQRVAIHAHREQIEPRDMQIVCLLRESNRPITY